MSRVPEPTPWLRCESTPQWAKDVAKDYNLPVEVVTAMTLDDDGAWVRVEARWRLPRPVVLTKEVDVATAK